MSNRHIILHAPDKGVLVTDFIPQDARILFKLIDRNREHLSQWGDKTAARYPNIRSVRKSIEHPRNSTKTRLGIWWNGKLVGTISLTPQLRTVKIGYWIGSEFCGNNLATTAIHSVVKYVKRLGDVDYMVARVRRENDTSQRVLKKAGIVQVHEDKTHIHFALDVKS